MSQPVPPRIGDAERDAAVKRLREHHAVGRLAPYEFNERMEAALQARTQADLEPLFADLPEVSETPFGLEPLAPLRDEGVVAERRFHGPSFADVMGWVSTLAWPITLIYLFATGWEHWWLILVPALLLPAMLQINTKDPRSIRSERAAERRARDKARKGIDQN